MTEQTDKYSRVLQLLLDIISIKFEGKNIIRLVIDARHSGLPAGIAASARGCRQLLFQISSHFLQSHTPPGKKKSSGTKWSLFTSIAPEPIDIRTSSSAIYAIR